MSVIADGFQQAFQLIVSGDGEMLAIMFRSLTVSLSAVGLASLIGLPLAAWLCHVRLPGRRAFELIVFNLMSLPTVVIGLIVMLTLSRSGPLGSLGLIYTAKAMIIAQFILTLPIVVGLSYDLMRRNGKRVLELAVTLGAGSGKKTRLLLREFTPGLALSSITAFSRAIAEVGAVMIVGGNIRHHTRVLTTAITLNNSMGEYGMAIALGLILLVLAFGVNSAIYFLSGKHRENRT
ncbi:MAG TPA: ABC transporter permease [Clostridiaceae bacterium]|nr:ABC transporter permease [Clostridiaceae bacterium]